VPLSSDQAAKLETYIRSSCADIDCGRFLEKFSAQVNDARFGAFLKNEMGLGDPETLIQKAFANLSVLRFNGIDSVCIEHAVKEIIGRTSKHWPA
jgi:hypothetical protein